jgi:hypothetical protein
MLLAALLVLAMEEPQDISQGPKSSPVTATVDVARVNTNINNAPNSTGVFQSNYSSTVFNLFLLQKPIQSPIRKTLTGFYYVNVSVGFETLPQTGGTLTDPPSPSAGFDSNAIKTASRTCGVLTLGLSFDTDRVNKSIKAAGPFLDVRLFDYIKNDNVGNRDRSGSYMVGYHYVVPLDDARHNIIQLELSVGHDKFYSEPDRIVGKAQYHFYPVKDSNSVFFDFSYNRNLQSVGPIELRYTAGVRFDLPKLISAMVGF